MFAKQASLAIAAITFAVAGSAFAADVKSERNVFDSEAALAAPAAQSGSSLTRQQVRAEFLAARAAGEISAFDSDTDTVAYVHQAPVRGEQATRLARAGK